MVEIDDFLKGKSLNSSIQIAVKIANSKTPSVFFNKVFIKFIVLFNADISIKFCRNKIFKFPFKAKVSHEYEPLYSTEMFEKIKFMVTFSIYGDNFSPTDITKQLNIKPTNFYYKGAQIPPMPGLYRMPNKPIPIRQESCWEFSMEQINDLNFEVLLNRITHTFKYSISFINEYAMKNDLKSRFTILIEIPLNNEVGLKWNKDFFKVVYDLNSEIDCDIYL